MLRCIPFAIFATVGVFAGVKEYRADYNYNHKTDAFYKLHTESVSYDSANLTCVVEGAKLMRANPMDITQAHMLLKEFPDIGNLIWAGDDGLPHQSAEDGNDVNGDYDNADEDNYYEPTNCEIITRQGKVLKTGCFNDHPFICKVEAKNIYVNSQCNVSSRGYTYVENVGSCYKFSEELKLTWNQAFAECQSERAHLLIINSEQEWQEIHNLAFHSQRSLVIPSEYWLVGIRANNTRDGSPLVFKTIFGQSLNEAGFAQWCYGEPNNFGGHEFCGTVSMFLGKYNDVPCSLAYSFICEKEIHT